MGASLAVRGLTMSNAHLCSECSCVRRQAAPKAQGLQACGEPRAYILCPGYWFSNPVSSALRKIAAVVTKTNRLPRQTFPSCSLPNGLDSDFLQPTSDVQMSPCEIHPPCKPCWREQPCRNPSSWKCADFPCCLVQQAVADAFLTQN